MGTGGEWTRGAFAPKKKNLTPPGNFFGVFLAKSSPGLLNKQPPPPTSKSYFGRVCSRCRELSKPHFKRDFRARFPVCKKVASIK